MLLRVTKDGFRWQGQTRLVSGFESGMVVGESSRAVASVRSGGMSQIPSSLSFYQLQLCYER